MEENDDYTCSFGYIDCAYGTKFYIAPENEIKAVCPFCQLSCQDKLATWKEISKEQYQEYLTLS